jgi:rhodanese-related sulfurtransferase
MMRLIKKYWLVLAVVLPLIALILLKVSGRSHFRGNAAKWARLSANSENLVTWQSIHTLRGDIMILDLGMHDRLNELSYGIMCIPVDSLLDKVKQRALRSHKGPLVIYSDSRAISARTWMLLSQMGYSNVYILVDTANPEGLKYEFRSDTAMIRPEL